MAREKKGSTLQQFEATGAELQALHERIFELDRRFWGRFSDIEDDKVLLEDVDRLLADRATLNREFMERFATVKVEWQDHLPAEVRRRGGRLHDGVALQRADTEQNVQAALISLRDREKRKEAKAALKEEAREAHVKLADGTEATREQKERFPHLTIEEMRERLGFLSSRAGGRQGRQVDDLKRELDRRLESIEALSISKLRRELSRGRDDLRIWADIRASGRDLSKVPEAFLGPEFRLTKTLIREEEALRVGGPVSRFKGEVFRKEYQSRTEARDSPAVREALDIGRNMLGKRPGLRYETKNAYQIVMALRQLERAEPFRPAPALGAAIYRELYILTREDHLDQWRTRGTDLEERAEAIAAQLMEAWHPPNALRMHVLEGRLAAAIRDTAEAETAAVRKQLFRVGDRLRQNMVLTAPVVMHDRVIVPSTDLGRSAMAAKRNLAKIYGRARLLPVEPKLAAKERPQQLKALAAMMSSAPGEAMRAALIVFPKAALIQGMVKQAAKVTVRTLAQETRREPGT